MPTDTSRGRPAASRQANRFELSITPPAVQAGEDIRILPADAAARTELGDEDFWLFDDELVAVLRFGDSGVAGAALIDDPAAVARYRAIQHRALSVAVPYETWAARPPTG
ncbi:DUF6879 family protein [Saccharothrix sp.]|uniref:DUF6879 family protein n=1 Tax=Saccharothrix sp. TaxID=1873460 RepID=UPI002812085E|nr:DUF6879 family protein [Saccharothrix sp.]